MAVLGEKQISTPMRAAYGVGTGIVAIKNMLFHFFFLYFFANVLGVNEWLIIAATWLAILVDAFTDPLMGQISDNTRSKRWGRRHKYMMMGVLPTMFGLVLLFSPPQGLGQGGLFAWMLGFLIVVRLGLTIYDVPYRSLGADLSTDYNERTSIVAWREFFTNFFSIMVFVIGLLIFLPETPEFEDGMLNRAGYAPFVLTMAIIGGAFALISTLVTRRKVDDIRRYSDTAQSSWRDTWAEIKTASRIKPFLWLSAGYCLMIILYAIGSALSFYVGGYLWRFTQVEKFLIAVVPLLVLIPAVMMATFLAKRLDKRPAVMIFCVIMGLGYTLPYLAYLMGLTPMGGSALLLFVMLFHCLAFIGLCGVLIISNSMIADVADDMHTRTGKRQEGLLASAFSFWQKFTFIIGTNIAALSLMIINFPKQIEPSQVDPAAIQGLAVVSIVAAIFFSLAGIVSYKNYGLDRQSVTALTD